MNYTATYSPEDNKLRLYADSRLPRELYDRVRAAGFQWAPKQELFVAPRWTPEREDLLLELAEEIDDEDYSATERAADRAERFSDYRDKRRAEAGDLADRYDAGPSAFGHQNRARAERQAARHDRSRTGAVSQWSKAEYWQARTAGVIASALYKSCAKVRRSRILRLEGEQRRAGLTSQPGEPGSMRERWANHYILRLEYERAMLAQEGGTAADADMEPGGWIGNTQIQAVNRSPVTKRVVSVKVLGPKSWHRGPEPAPIVLKTCNIERLPEGAYRAPTDDERAQFARATKERKAEEKAGKPAPPPLINPTDADAQRLQDLWNSRVKARHEKAKSYGAAPVSELIRMTQAAYSERSKGEYGPCETSDVSEFTEIRSGYYTSRERGRITVFKVRTCTAGGSSMYGSRRVVILTDKPQKPIPWAEIDRARATQPTEADVFPRLGEIVAALSVYGTDAQQEKLFADARYVGWLYSSSQTQRGLTEAGQEAYKRFLEAPKVEEAEEVEAQPVGSLF